MSYKNIYVFNPDGELSHYWDHTQREISITDFVDSVPHNHILWHSRQWYGYLDDYGDWVHKDIEHVPKKAQLQVLLLSK